MIFADYYIKLCGYALIFTPIGFFADELRKNGFVLLCSLPVKRKQIVVSKFVFILIFMIGTVLFFTLLALLLLNISDDFDKKLIEIKSGVAHLPFFLILSVLFLSAFSVSSFKSGTSKNLMSIYFMSWLKYIIPVGIILMIILILFFKDADLDLLIKDLEIFSVLIGMGLLLALAMYVIARFSVKVFEQRDL